MEPTTALGISAQIAVAIAGFAGVVAAFRSDSVRDAAYQTLTKAARAQRHSGVAKALKGAVGQLDDRAHHAATAAEIYAESGPASLIFSANTFSHISSPG